MKKNLEFERVRFNLVFVTSIDEDCSSNPRDSFLNSSVIDFKLSNSNTEITIAHCSGFPSLLQVYKKKTELAKKEYLKQLAVYRASLVSKVLFESSNSAGATFYETLH